MEFFNLYGPRFIIMESLLEAELICSAGLRFTLGDSSILVDALNQAIQSFRVISQETAKAILSGEPPYTNVQGLLYTHLHPDHYAPALNAQFLQLHPGVKTFFPNPDSPDHGILNVGPFTVEYQYLEHTPCNYTWRKHYVLLISAGGVRIYVTSDASLDPAQHLAFLGNRHVDYSFWNSMYLSYPETRRLMDQVSSKVYIYHMPEPEGDRSGFCRKAQLNLQRYPEELRKVTVLETYPTFMMMPKLDQE